MLRDKVKKEIDKVLKSMGLEAADFVIEHPEDMDHGDFACNVAMTSFSKLKSSELAPMESGSQQVAEVLNLKSPRELAEKIAEKLDESNLNKLVKKIEVAGPGFINISIQEEALIKEAKRVLKGKFDSQVKWGKKVMVEYAHPNTHKQFHIGHLRNIALGESITRLLEAVGVEVIRVNYQGDVGLHIAKAMWGILSILDEFNLVKSKSILERIEFLGMAYAKGAKAYEIDETVKKEIIEINRQIYRGEGEAIEVYKKTRQWSLDYFEKIYKRVGTKYDRFYFESECGEGLEIAKKALKEGILTKSKGAVVFDGSKYGLDTRVFINSIGLATYEAKELGLAPKEFTEFGKIDKCIHVVGPEQKSFFEVTFKVEELIDPKMFAGKQYHRVYELVDLKGGKMSSRTGKVVTGWWLLDEAVKKVKDAFKVDDETVEMIGVGAVKYSFLKVNPMQKIAFDLEESVTLNGNSGPYLQYAYARCQSVLAKADSKFEVRNLEYLSEEEARLLRSLYRFEEVVVEAACELSPNLVCNYLYDLASFYNSFYNKHKILTAKTKEQKEFRLWLTKAIGEILKRGLELLGIEAPEKM